MALKANPKTNHQYGLSTWPVEDTEEKYAYKLLVKAMLSWCWIMYVGVLCTSSQIDVGQMRKLGTFRISEI